MIIFSGRSIVRNKDAFGNFELMIVYRIETDVDHFQSLRIEDEMIASSDLMAFDGSTRLDIWPRNLQVVIDNLYAPRPDVFDLGAGNLVVHCRSMAILEPVLKEHCEFLPIYLEANTLVAVNVVGLADCLDADRSKWEIGKESGKRIRIEEFKFFPERIPICPLFKIPQRRYELFCTEPLKSLLEAHALTGINCAQVFRS